MKGKIIFLLSLFAISTNAVAVNCYEKSPSLVSLGDEYFGKVVDREITAKEKDKLKSLYRALSGKWEGRVIFSDCKGSEKAPRKQVKNSRASMEIADQSKLKISMKMYFEESDKNKQRTDKLLRNEKVLNFNFISSGHLEYTELMRIRNAEIGARLVENLYTINIENDDTLTFSIIYYVNGVFIGDEKWSMTRWDKDNF